MWLCIHLIFTCVFSLQLENYFSMDLGWLNLFRPQELVLCLGNANVGG